MLLNSKSEWGMTNKIPRVIVHNDDDHHDHHPHDEGGNDCPSTIRGPATNVSHGNASYSDSSNNKNNSNKCRKPLSTNGVFVYNMNDEFSMLVDKL